MPEKDEFPGVPKRIPRWFLRWVTKPGRFAQILRSLKVLFYASLVLLTVFLFLKGFAPGPNELARRVLLVPATMALIASILIFLRARKRDNFRGVWIAPAVFAFCQQVIDYLRKESLFASVFYSTLNIALLVVVVIGMNWIEVRNKSKDVQS